MSTKEFQKGIVSSMKNWQQLENSTIAVTGQSIERTKNPIIHMILEAIND